MAKPNIQGDLPGPKTKEIVDRDHRSVVRTTKTTDVAAESAQGWLVHDVDGNTFLDFTSGIGVTNTGHCHPKVVEAIQQQAGKLMHFAGTDFYYDAMPSYAERLTGIAPVAQPSKVFYTQSGTESIEAAIKLTRHKSRRPLMLAFRGCFHGRTLGSLSLTSSKPVHRRHFQPLLPGVYHAPYPDPYRNTWDIDGYLEPGELTNRVLDHIEGMFESFLPPEDLAACFVEPLQGEGGYVTPPADFLGRLKRLLEEHGVALVADEVQSGFGRTGKMFACDHFNVKPDLICLAKGIASGMPMGAVVAREEYDFATSGSHSNTYGGNLVCLAAANATLDVLTEDGLVENAAKMGTYLREGLEDLQNQFPAIGDVRGMGLWQAIDLVKDPSTKEPDKKLRDHLVQDAYKRGLLVLPCGPSAIRLIPPLGIDTESIDAALDVLTASFKSA
ncbi:MAG: acetyl ornithine aminotransferase family protein [Candidatus Thermoplasmatota archaeon]|nr:acetyl ornithine aminotransferase family protein [Candidatus Thermoplasmatota archaeon]